MNRILDNFLEYNKIIIVSYEDSELLSEMVYQSITNRISSFFNDMPRLRFVNKYKMDDLFYEDVTVRSLNKYSRDGRYESFVIRVKGNGFNINNLGLNKSFTIFHNADLVLAIKKGMCIVLSDRYNEDKKRECDISMIIKNMKLKKILNKINGIV